MTTTARVVWLTFALLLVGLGTAQAQRVWARGRASQSETFERTLSSSGDWLVVAPYGRVWRPSAAVVGVSFVPYATGGQWVYTDYGWSFEAPWDWSWVAFHYGRWVDVPAQGWAWVPGNVWGPAWVDWRVGGNYIGWAPLPPGADVVETDSTPWLFVQATNFVSPNVVAHAMPPPLVRWVHRVTQPAREVVRRGDTHWYAGPPVAGVSAAARVQIRRARVVPPSAGRVQRVRPAPRVLDRPNVRVAPPPGQGSRGRPGRPGTGDRR